MFPKWDDYVLNVTGIISYEVKLTWSSCTRMTLDSYTWFMEYLDAFSDPEATYSYPVSLL